VWIGATLALSLTSLLGVAAGRTLLRRIPLKLLQRLSGLLFLLLAAIAAWRVVQLLSFQA
jgi:putative Ca2+/H+ antiporter (TMEM165/GDT1 family)